MISNMAVPIGQTSEKLQVLRFSDTSGSLAGFPVLYIDKDSYIVSFQNEAGLNLNSDFVYNFHVGKHTAIAHEIKIVIDINHNYNAVCCGNLTPSPLGRDAKGGNKPALVEPPKRKGQILIQNDVWIGRGATLMGGVTIHNGAVVAANSVVTKDVEPYSIVGGNPAKHIRYRFDEQTIRKLLAIQWWYWDEKKIRQNLEWFAREAPAFADHFFAEIERAAPEPAVRIEKKPCEFLYFSDFQEKKFATWRKVVSAFCKTFAKREDCELLVFIPEGKDAQKHYDEIMRFVQDMDVECSLYLYVGVENDAKDLLHCADYLITGRLEQTVYYSSMADLYGVKTLSGVDLPVFDDESHYGSGRER